MKNLNDVWSLYFRFKSSSHPEKKSIFVDLNRWKHGIKPYIGSMSLDSIKSYTILEYSLCLEAKGLSPQTVKHSLSLVQRLLRRGESWELYPRPIPFFEMSKEPLIKSRFNQLDAKKWKDHFL